jgi:two-component system phosphate regulon response regulator PhoB
VSLVARTIGGMSEIQSPRTSRRATDPLHPIAPRTAILVIEEPCVRDLISGNLRALGWFAVTAPTSSEGSRLASQVLPDVVVLDLDSPATSDRSWLLELAQSCASGKPLRTVMLSSPAARDAGAVDDGIDADLWVTKPLDASDLMVRLSNLLRPQRARPATPRAKAALRFAAIELDRHQPTIRVRQEGDWLTLDLARTEHRLLECLLTDPARIHSRESIRESIWPGVQVELRTVDQYVRRLRRTLRSVDAGNLIGTVVGAGYRLRPEVLDRATK